jgi:hypothetical protein
MEKILELAGLHPEGESVVDCGGNTAADVSG